MIEAGLILVEIWGKNGYNRKKDQCRRRNNYDESFKDTEF